VAFQAPFEIPQSRLETLRISSVDSRETQGAIFPFFDGVGLIRFLVIHMPGEGTAGGAAGSPGAPGAPAAGTGDAGGAWLVEDFPLEIRRGKAIYPRPIVKYRPLDTIDPAVLSGSFHLDGRRILPVRPGLAGPLAAALDRGNIALRARGREKVLDLFFTLDLRRLTGTLSRAGLFLRRRMELAALRAFLRDTEPATS
jgi:hypothetical protein